MGILLDAEKALGQTNYPARKFIENLDSASQTNIEVFAGGMNDEQPCPPEYTNAISNTNLFSVEEQKFLEEIPTKFGRVTTNSGPPEVCWLSSMANARFLGHKLVLDSAFSIHEFRLY